MNLDVSVPFKDLNQLRVLNLVRLYPGISRTEIAEQIHLGKPTVSNIVGSLVGAGLVREMEPHTQISGPGRRPVGLELERLIRLSVGMELTGDECIGVLTDIYACPLRVVRHTFDDTTVGASLSLMARVVDHLMEGYDPSRVLGIGVGVPGPVDPSHQDVIAAVNLGWFDVPLAPLFEEKIGRPVIVVKRQTAGALAEYRQGVGQGKDSLLFISVGSGIGCGMILGGELYEGVDGTSGQIGHIVVVPNGSQCNCGNRGCLEAVAGHHAIINRAIEMCKVERGSLLAQLTRGMLQSITIRTVIEAARQHDRIAIEIVEEAGTYLGMALAAAANLLDPRMIIIGGELTELGDLYLGPVKAVVRREVVPLPSATSIQIVLASLGDQAASVGAAALAIDRAFSTGNPFAHELGL